ncbi:MAG: tetratricopeptide repeat protein [Flavobacteriales bacterium]|nr:tetratricopeptide repeat protein [Flavobacteriales bacterium]
MKTFQLKYVLSLTITLFVCLTPSFSQTTTDEKLALQFFNNEEYDKAVVYFEKLYNKTHETSYYERLLQCYLYMEEYKDAEKLVKKHQKKHPYQLAFMVDLGVIYEVAGEKSKAEKTFSDAVKSLTANNQQIIDLANSFIKNKEYDLAIETYLKGRKLLKGTYEFNFELAQVYNQQGKTELMFKEYINILDIQPAYIQSVQNAIQTNLGNDDDGSKKDILKSLLIKETQKSYDQVVFSEMLIWLYIQELNFKGAFIQTKALDKRFREEGKRIFSLADLCLSNKDYETAIDCYQYIIDLGKNNRLYNYSRIQLLQVYYTKITTTASYTNEEVIELEKKYETAIKELGNTNESYLLVKNLAHLKAFYLNKPIEAQELIDSYMNILRLTDQEQAELKIELADINLFLGDIWEASLLYSQVEKSFKHSQIGETAKFKNAKISFYTGDFDWAKAQLDVLKASTSKLIANDAMKLSITITDNIGIDTTKAPLLLFAKADLLFYQNQYNEALEMLDSLKTTFPIHVIGDDVLYKQHEIYFSRKNLPKAIEKLEQIIKEYSYDLLVDDALYKLATIYDYELNDKSKAQEYYKKIIFEHQGSIYVVDARKRFRDLQQTPSSIDLEQKLIESETN